MATTLNNLAVLFQAQGKYPETEPLYRRALVIRERALGPEHPDTVAVAGNYVGLLRQLGRADEAQAITARFGL
jgi:hypothetical protein